MNPLISVIVPVYGVEKYISRCAKSLFEQTYDNIEYIFVDDCTPDHSISELEKVIASYPRRSKHVHIVKHKRNMGLAAARNTGLDNANGEFIAHIDSDDYVNNDYIEAFVNRQKATDADIVIGQVVYAYLNNKTKPIPLVQYENKRVYLKAVLGRKTNTNVAGKIIRRELYEKNHIRNVIGIDNSEDYQVYPQLLFFAKSFAFEPQAEYMYYQGNGTSYSNSHKEESERQIFKSIEILRDFFKEHDTSYLPCLDEADFAVLTWNIKHWCYVNGHDDFFNEIRSRILSYDKSYLNSIDWKSKIALYGNRKIIQAIYRMIHTSK